MLSCACRPLTSKSLVSIITELKSLGFDEVVLADMAIPDTKSIVFKQDKVEAITKAAKTLVDTCSTESFAVSFVGGTGNIGGVVVGVFLLRIIFVALNFLSIDANLQYIIKGLIILIACAIDMRKYLVRK